MTPSTDRIEQIFQDARELQASAVERSWTRGTSGTPLSRPGELPEGDGRPGAGQNRRGNRSGHRRPEPDSGQLAFLDEAVRDARLVRRYYTRQGSLHGHCFYMGLCDPGGGGDPVSRSERKPWRRN